jgi:hypothetical protein
VISSSLDSGDFGCVRCNLPQRPFQSRPQLIQLARVISRKPAQELPAPWRYVQDCATLVLHIRLPIQEALAHRPVNQFDSTVVLQTQPLGRVRDGHRHTFWRARHLKKELVLLWL